MMSMFGIENIYSFALSIVAIVVSLVAFFFTFFQNRKGRISQIQTAKLEELLECVYELSKFYGEFKLLENKIVEKNKEGSNISFEKYRENYEYGFIVKRHEKIDVLLSRVEVLYKVYTKGKINSLLGEYFNMMDCFYMYVLNTGDLQKSLKYPKGFPTESEFRKVIEDIEVKLIVEIKKYK